ncbi:hypothetical protein ALP49_200006 [Pseudomonas syringae pv. solidagae]|nr:hypothetical protein ALP49_200006 [Pseudomonas syringae pv. solidagae]
MQMTTPYRQLAQGQRHQIEASLGAEQSQASIPKQLRVHRSRISREVLRNSPKKAGSVVCAKHESDVQPSPAPQVLQADCLAKPSPCDMAQT